MALRDRLRARRDAKTEPDEPEEAPTPRNVGTMRFSSSAPKTDDEAVDETVETDAGDDGPTGDETAPKSKKSETKKSRDWISRRTAIASASMLGAAAVVWIFSLGFTSSVADPADVQEVSDLRSRTRGVQAQIESLPGASEVKRQLATAADMAEQVAGLQNDYRILAHDAAAGEIDPVLTAPTRMSLRGYFVSGTDETYFEL